MMNMPHNRMGLKRINRPTMLGISLIVILPILMPFDRLDGRASESLISRELDAAWLHVLSAHDDDRPSTCW
jgi:hypothetical protein